LAKQLLGMFPWIGKLWSSAVREAGGGSIGRYKVLGILNGKGPTRAGELATLCVSSPSAMSEIIEGLSAEGFVRRVDDPTDRRAVVVTLTPQGQAELDRVGELMTAELARRFADLTGDERSRLRSAIGDITEILIDPPAKKENPIVR
jgi:DNA-binding MarR family transcriptional regulator